MSKTRKKSKLLRAINEMERACLAPHARSGRVECVTAADIKQNGKAETRAYFYWLKQQAPQTGLMYDFDRLWEDR